jgi:UDP-N-acetylglucosamine transferase subunit ALG13
VGILARVLSSGPLRRSSDLTTFVTVGNGTQPFDRLLGAVAKAQHVLPQPVFVQRGSTNFAHPTWNVRDFIDMQEFERLMQQSTLLIMHAGAGSIINAVRTGKRPVVMPRRACYGEIVDDHQVDFAAALAREDHVVLAREPADLVSAIERACAETARSVEGDDPPLVEHLARLLASLGQTGAYHRAK